MLNKLFDKQNLSKQFYKLIAASFVCCAMFMQAPNCQAYYWGPYNWGSWAYYGLGSSLLWPLNSLVYPSTGNSYAYGLGWPLYSLSHLGNRYANNMAINSYRNIPYTNYGNYPYTNNYAAYNYPLNTNPNPNYPFNYNNYTIGQSPAVPIWNQPPKQNSAKPIFNDPNDIFNYRYPSPNNSYIPNNLDAKIPPQVAPNRHYLSQASNENNLAPLTNNASAAEGFFQTINTRYKGNLIRALSQPDIKSWAQSLGLYVPDHKTLNKINRARSNSISTIVKDMSLSSHKKLDILRLLLQ